ncbi:leukemia inhibitory factor receptor-like [Notolabrus celidotus]|uniref:leukemia inhibitory factor receptor-like n=1 Tax=Notolabrus celidotus TaxID=1203425 RepID=UPI00148FB3D1|nr:leukemia inhibitory factor receptor-like [Notolabrus celidotus]
MITWLLLVLLFCKSKQDKDGTEGGVSHCGPLNLTLTSSDQTIMSTWKDDPSCSAARDGLRYEVVVLIEEQEVHHEEVAVMSEQIGLTHSWRWTSSLVLECASHTVRIRSNMSTRTQEKTLPGKRASKKPEVYPQGKVFAVHSTATFCCILPAREVFNKMYLSGYNESHMKITRISNHTYTLTVLLDKPSKYSCTNVKCQSSNSGACAYIGYPPGDRDLQCETRDMETVDCYWEVGRKTNLSTRKISTKHQLNGRNCSNSSMGRCSLKVEEEAGERNWTLMAQNPLGQVELTDRADLMQRVRMFAPMNVSDSTVNARNVTLTWEWEVQRYHDLDITCQVHVSHEATKATSKTPGIGLRSAVVMDLIPNWNYKATVRCGTTQHLWKWGDWSTSVDFHTRGDVPDALDVWMQTEENQTVVVWKELRADQSHGDILEYEVSWAKTTEREQRNTTTADRKSHSVILDQDPAEEHIIIVRARNINGSSSPSTIIIPRRKPDRTTVNTSRIIGSDGGFNLSWSESPAAGCGYIVDWCPTSESCRMEWLKVSPDQTKARVVSKNFRDGQRYTLSVYACTHTAPVLLERREGYIKEQRMKDSIFTSLKWNQQDSDVVVSWKPVPLRDQTAFIVGFVLYCEDDNNKIVCNVSTDNPDATTLTATNLNITTYTFTVKAKTAVGECGASSITATLNSLTDALIQVVSISLVSVFGLLSLITILCYRHWSCIKHKVYPPIPKPVLRDNWFTPGDNSRHFHVGQSHHSEPDIMEVPELHRKPGAPVYDYMTQENLAYVSAQTLKSYYNQSVRNCIQQPFSLPYIAVPAQSGKPPPPSKSLIPNLTYNLTTESEYQPCSWSPEPQEGAHSKRGCDGYLPQKKTGNVSVNQTEERQDKRMSCVSAYVVLPHS